MQIGFQRIPSRFTHNSTFFNDLFQFILAFHEKQRTDEGDSPQSINLFYLVDPIHRSEITLTPMAIYKLILFCLSKIRSTPMANASAKYIHSKFFCILLSENMPSSFLHLGFQHFKFSI